MAAVTTTSGQFGRHWATLCGGSVVQSRTPGLSPSRQRKVLESDDGALAMTTHNAHSTAMVMQSSRQAACLATQSNDRATTRGRHSVAWHGAMIAHWRTEDTASTAVRPPTCTGCRWPPAATDGRVLTGKGKGLTTASYHGDNCLSTSPARKKQSSWLGRLFNCFSMRVSYTVPVH